MLWLHPVHQASRVAFLQAPVAANAAAVQQELDAVKSVASVSCPVMAVLERVVFTSSGVLVACWQVRATTSQAGYFMH